MPGPTLSADELADELGRKSSWVYDNWQRLRKEQRLPAPLNGGEAPLRWSRAQIYAWIDRGLTRSERIAAQAYRAAAAAAEGVRHTGDDALAIEEATARIGERLSQEIGR